MGDINVALQWFRDRLGKVYYSMNYRNGQQINANGQPVAYGGRPGFDCSSSVYYALIAANIFPAGTRIGNTDSLFNDLEKYGWERVPFDANGNADVQAGDIFIWGKRGASVGAFGHTGGFVGTNGKIIHCSYGYNGIHEDPHDWLWELNGQPEYAFYRYTGKPYTPPSIQGSPTDQVLEKGSLIKFTNVYTVDDLKEIGDLWQVKTEKLCPEDFSWEDNGIPVNPLIEVDKSGYRTADQDLSVGSQYVIPGKFEVLDLGEFDGMWLARIGYGKYSWWVDVSTATEVDSNDAGTPEPKEHPQAPPKPVETKVTSSPADVTVPTTQAPAPVTQSQPSVQPSNNPSNVNETKPKEETMAFSADQQAKLKSASEKMEQDLDKSNVSVVDKDGKTSKQALIGAVYLLFRAWAISIIAVMVSGLLVGHIDWELVKTTAGLSALLGLDKFFHDNPKIPINGITGF